MSRQLFFSTSLIFLLTVIIPSNGIFGLFKSQASASPNTFSVVTVFPSPSPSLPPEQQFPDCPTAPGGNVNGKKWDVGYAEGWHWIIFEGMKYGSDYVYYLGGKNGKDKVLQCYYPVPPQEGHIQTNWLKQKNQIEGWQEWENGADFGLNKGLYQVKNILAFPTPQPTSSPAATPEPTSTPTADPSPTGEPTPSETPSPTPSSSPVETEVTESSPSGNLSN